MPVFRRYGRPGLLDAIGSAAIVSGSSATIARVLNHTASDQNDGARSLAAELRMLSALHEAGHISSEEFVAAKSHLLGA